MRDLTDTEIIVLANIRNLQPCTAYAVMKQIARSPVAQYSDSSGTMYPTVERLVERKLLRTRNHKTGRRASRLLSCTKAGEAEIRKWLFDLDPRRNFPIDPLRSRMCHLLVLSPKETRDWLTKARESIDAQIALLSEFERGAKPVAAEQYYQCAHANSRLLMDARIAWLDGIKAQKLLKKD